MTYHHGSLRQTMLEAAAAAVAAQGVAALSLRALAREAGVSHAAPRHHFGDKQGLLTALAADGYARLADGLTGAGGDFLEMGVAYVRFALEHPGHFAVMYQPELVDETDAELQKARGRTRVALVSGATRYSPRADAGTEERAEASVPEGTEVTADADAADPGSPALPPMALLAWSAAHGLANLALAGTLTRMGHGDGVEELTAAARRALNLLVPP